MCCSRSHHDTFHELDAKTYPDNDADYCRCPGSDSGGCCGAISGQTGCATGAASTAGMTTRSRWPPS
jgi:hypothetical protein